MVKFVLVGGFLGSGKTTMLLRLAASYVRSGKRVGIITNDQAGNLVDTETFLSEGFATEEVPGGCFCCRFTDLLQAAGKLADGHQPDILLAEPVGSCTDLVASVIRPLRQLYSDQFITAPYVTLLDPDRAWQALSGTGAKGLSAKVSYIFKMQQHEADIVAINKIDTLSPERRKALLPLVQQNFPDAKLVEISARTGEGVDDLMALIEHPGSLGIHGIDVDYEIYAAGEAELGWLNADVQLDSADVFCGDSFLIAFLNEVQRQIGATEGEPAHVKVTLESGKAMAIANLVHGQRPAELSRTSNWKGTNARLLVNARVQCSPDSLNTVVVGAMKTAAEMFNVTPTYLSLAHFAPGRPQPTHRITI